MKWADADTELLKKLWSDGLSASQIAGRIGGATRSGVIGKVHRLGLPGRKTVIRKKPVRNPTQDRRFRPKARPAKVPAEARSVPIWKTICLEEPLAPVVEIEIQESQRRTMETLERGECKWPIGDPQSPEFYFCGGKQVPGLPYCEHHARRAYQPVQVKRPAGAARAPAKETVDA